MTADFNLRVERRPASRPLVLLLDGLCGRSSLEPTSFGPDWLGYNDPAWPTEWSLAGEFAALRSNSTRRATVGYPSLPIGHYVLETEIEFAEPGAAVIFSLGDPQSCVQLRMDWNEGTRKIGTRLCEWRYGGWAWNGSYDFNLGDASN